MACTASADGWVSSPCRTRKMHCRWAVTFRPVERNSSVSSSGVFTPATISPTSCFSTMIVEKAPDTAGRPRARHRPAGGLSDAVAGFGRCPTAVSPWRRRGRRVAFDRAGGPGPPGRPGDLRRAGHRRGHHRCRGGPRRRQPGAAHRPGGEGRLRLGDLVQVVEARPRGAALPPTARVPAGLREPGRAPAALGQRSAPGLTRCPFSSPCSARTGWSTPAWPAPTGRPCGSTT